MKKLLITIISLYGNIHDESKKNINMKNNTVNKKQDTSQEIT